jgi:hypothetical protein
MAPEQVIQRLFDFCAALFRSIVVTRRAYRLLDDYGWTEEKDRFIIWGDGFDISEGELDNSFSTKNVQHLRRSVEILLSSLAGSLLRRVLYSILTLHRVMLIRTDVQYWMKTKENLN